MGFIRKVYLIIMAQMAVTASMIITFMYTPSLQYWIVFGNGWYLGIPCCLIMITCQIAIYCCKDVRRRVPHNYIILFVFTLCMSYFATQIAVIEGYKQEWVVLMAAVQTFAITVAVTAYGCYEKEQFRIPVGMAFVFAMTFMWFFILSLFMG